MGGEGERPPAKRARGASPSPPPEAGAKKMRAKVTKRAASPSEGKAAPAAAAMKPAKPKKLAHSVSGPLKRSAAALEALSTRRSKEEIWSHVEPYERRSTDSAFDAPSMVRLVSWNVAGLRGLLRKDSNAIANLLLHEQVDVLCLQETKLNPDEAAANAQLGVVEGYTFVDHACTAKRGYSGTRTYVRSDSALAAGRGLFVSAGGLQTLSAGDERLAAPPAATAPGAAPALRGSADEEGRVLTTFFSPTSTKSGAASAFAPTLAVVNTYIPNSGMTLDRLPYRTETFDRDFRAYLKSVDEACQRNGKQAGAGPAGFIWTGDLNVAERDYDRYYAGTFKSMQECSGFTPEERWSFRETLRTCDGVDSFRALYPSAGPAYTFWSMRLNGRTKGLGWRLDYFVVSQRLLPLVKDCFPMPHVMGSDHCPVQLWLAKQ